MNLELNDGVFETHRYRIFAGYRIDSMFNFVGNFEHIIQMIVWGHFESGLELYELESNRKLVKLKKGDIKSLLNNHWIMEQLNESETQKCFEKLNVKQ